MKRLLTLVSMSLYLLVPTMAHGQKFPQPDGSIVNRLVFPQIAFGGGWSTTIVVTNVSNSPAQVTLGFGSPDGGNLSVPIVLRNGSILMAGGYNPGSIQPKGTWTTTIRSDAPVATSGAMTAMFKMVDGKDPLQVQVTYSYAPNGNIEGQAVVLAVTPAKSFGLQMVRTNQSSDVGVAIANLNWSPANVTIKVRNMAGVEVSSISLTIPVNGQVAKMFTSLAPELSNWTGGLVEVSSDQDIAVMSLQFNGSVFSSGTTF